MKKSVWGIVLFIAAILLLVIFDAKLIRWFAGGFIILYGLVFLLSAILDCEEINDDDENDDYFNEDNPIIKGQGH